MYVLRGAESLLCTRMSFYTNVYTFMDRDEESEQEL